MYRIALMLPLLAGCAMAGAVPPPAMITPPVVVQPFDGFPCGEGPHMIHNAHYIECNPASRHVSVRIKGVAHCQGIDEVEWSDWPRCEGATLTGK